MSTTTYCIPVVVVIFRKSQSVDEAQTGLYHVCIYNVELVSAFTSLAQIGCLRHVRSNIRTNCYKRSSGVLSVNFVEMRVILTTIYICKIVSLKCYVNR